MSYTERMKALADGHINFVLWLSGERTFSDQPVAIKISGQFNSSSHNSWSVIIFGVSTTCVRSTVEFQRHSFAHRLY